MSVDQKMAKYWDASQTKDIRSETTEAIGSTAGLFLGVETPLFGNVVAPNRHGLRLFSYIALPMAGVQHEIIHRENDQLTLNSTLGKISGLRFGIHRWKV